MWRKIKETLCNMLCGGRHDVHCERPPLPDGRYRLVNPKYMGMWIGAYDTLRPSIDSFTGETCTTAYIPSEKIWEFASERIAGNPKSYQAKYFEQGILFDTFNKCLDLHTLIWEVNVNSRKIWWTYGKRYLPQDIETPKEVSIITADYWLKETKGWNRHCKFWLGYDCCLSQHFVRWHRRIK